MPVYTLPYPLAEPAIDTTLPNDIREGNPNPWAEPVVSSDNEEDVFLNTQIKPLSASSSLPDGEEENYKRQYYYNLFSAPTTAGYTEMQQVTFTRHTGVISGYQIGLPIR